MATYACKDLGKSTAWGRPKGAHLFFKPHGIKPLVVAEAASTQEGGYQVVLEAFGRAPERVWDSAQCPWWFGPPTLWLDFGPLQRSAQRSRAE